MQRHHKLIGLFVLFFGLFSSFVCVSQTNSTATVELTLERLDCLKVSEHKRDEIYFSIFTMNKNGDSELHRVPPNFPVYWPTKKDHSIANVPLLKIPVNENDTVTVVISLMEADLSKFDSDDLIGSAKVVLHNRNNKITSDWRISNVDGGFHTKMIGRKGQPMYKMVGDNGAYQVSFKLVSVDK